MILLELWCLFCVFVFFSYLCQSTVLCYHVSLCHFVVVLSNRSVTKRVTMSARIKRGNYNQEYHHKQSRYVVKEYSRYKRLVLKIKASS